MKIEIEFLGAAGNVTGSKTLLHVNGKRYLVDCGLFQGPKSVRELNWQESLIPHAHEIEHLILTHAHLDHTGYIPRFVTDGFKGKIHCTKGTAELLKIMLLDSAKIQEEDAQYANKTKHSHHNPALALYTVKDAEAALELLNPQPRQKWIPIDERVSFRYVRNGHIVGSSALQFSIDFGHGVKILTFSGDVGHGRSLILKGPDEILESDFLVLESTYGDELHEQGSPILELGQVIQKVCGRGGVLIIPSFAVGRTQELLFMIKTLEREGHIPHYEVILDSPMASKANEVFLKIQEYHKSPDLFKSGLEDLVPQNYRETERPDDSMLACLQEGPLIVIAGAGMLNGGRVLHHLKKRLENEVNGVLFVGYQEESTKGFYLLREARKTGHMRIHHQEIPIEAEIMSLSSLSAHGDYQDLMKWLEGFENVPRKIFLNHGSPIAMNTFQKTLTDKYGESTLVETVLENKKYTLYEN